jgi:hypothetical protein
MSSRVNVCAVNFLDNPAGFVDPFKVEIVFEAFEYLPHGMFWFMYFRNESFESDFHILRIELFEVFVLCRIT